MKNKIKIAPSLLAADFTRLGDEVRKVDAAGADMIHFDVMDGRFVPNISFGPVVLKAVRDVTRLPLCAHLMIEEPWNYLQQFAESGADEIVVHAEACGPNLSHTLEKIRALKKLSGVSIKPQTPIAAIAGVLKSCDVVLLMTVNPGFGGQKFMPEVLPKISELRARFDGDIAVDGGIKAERAKLVVDAGANVLVAGTAIFGQPDFKSAIAALRESAAAHKE